MDLDCTAGSSFIIISHWVASFPSNHLAINHHGGDSHSFHRLNSIIRPCCVVLECHLSHIIKVVITNRLNHDAEDVHFTVIPSIGFGSQGFVGIFKLASFHHVGDEVIFKIPVRHIPVNFNISDSSCGNSCLRTSLAFHVTSAFRHIRSRNSFRPVREDVTIGVVTSRSSQFRIHQIDANS